MIKELIYSIALFSNLMVFTSGIIRGWYLMSLMFVWMYLTWAIVIFIAVLHLVKVIKASAEKAKAKDITPQQ